MNRRKRKKLLKGPSLKQLQRGLQKNIFRHLKSTSRIPATEEDIEILRRVVLKYFEPYLEPTKIICSIPEMTGEDRKSRATPIIHFSFPIIGEIET